MWKLTLFLGVHIVCGCALDASGDDAWTDPDKSDPSASGVAQTRAANARLLDGFNRLLDSTSDACVVAADSKPAFSVGDIAKPFDLFFVSSKEDLARTLGIDLALKIKYGATSIGPSFDFLDSFKQTRSAIHLLVAARASYRVTNLRAVSLTEDALGWLATDPHQFLNRCGNLYINGVEYEAQLFVMIRISALTEDASRTIAGDLGLGATTGALGLDATAKAKLEAIAKRSDVVVETHVLDRGFRADGGTGSLIASLLASGVTADTFTKIDAIRNTLLASLSADATRDLDPANAVRDAVPVRLDLRSYARAHNAPVGGPGSPYETMRKWLAGADDTLRTLGAPALELAAIRTDEIKPFLAASPDRQAFYGVLPPAAPVTSLDALVALAEPLAEPLPVELALEDRIASCFAFVSEGAPDACADADATTADADAVLASAVHIAPLRLSPRGVLGFRAAGDACAAAGLRLPTLAEARQLAIPIGYASLQRSTDPALRFAAWHGDGTPCTTAALSNPPGGTLESICANDTVFRPHPTTTLCVPGDGP